MLLKVSLYKTDFINYQLLCIKFLYWSRLFYVHYVFLFNYTYIQLRMACDSSIISYRFTVDKKNVLSKVAILVWNVEPTYFVEYWSLHSINKIIRTRSIRAFSMESYSIKKSCVWNVQMFQQLDLKKFHFWQLCSELKNKLEVHSTLAIIWNGVKSPTLYNRSIKMLNTQ